MSRITVDASFLAQIPAVGSSTEVCDDSGQVIGWFVPNPIPTKADYDAAWAEFDVRELEEALKEEGGVTTPELLERLSKL